MAPPAPAPYLSYPGGPRLSRSFRHGRSPRGNLRRPLPSADAFLLLPLVALLLSPTPFSRAPSTSFRAPFSPAPSFFRAQWLFPGGVASAHAAPMSVLDVFRPSCPLPPMSGPSGGWNRWSDVTVWGAAFKSSRDPPGVRSRAGGNVTIPCGMAVLLDVANVSLDTLHVHGWLKLLDDKPRLPRIEIRANFIIVTGRLTVGEKDKQFAAQALFTLTPNSGRQRREYGFTLFPPAEPAFPRPLGHKVFAVVGGQVDLHGLPGPPSMPVWVCLNKTATAGQTEIVVDADVSTWPVGSEIAIASTSAKMDEAEKAVIAGVSPHPQGYRILLSAPLKYSHNGNPKAVPDGFGGVVDVRGEVGLLHRNIVIYGVHETGKYELEGGHFIVFMTQTPQFIEGVQFSYMGQQGVLGRYPLHFHVCGEANQSHIVRKNAIVYSKQRCVVIHATSNMTIEDTVTFESKGHCFIVEEGSENNNVFKRNLGISHTDDKPSTFWMANPNNDYIDNVAAGSEDSGYWTELKEGMRGLSQLLPNARNMHPIETKFGTYSGNVAHSAKFGFRSYPHGMFPYAPGARVTLSNFLIYRNEVGMFLHITRLMTIQSSTFIDNGLSIHVKTDTGIVVDRCQFIGRTQACPAAGRQLLGDPQHVGHRHHVAQHMHQQQQKRWGNHVERRWHVKEAYGFPQGRQTGGGGMLGGRDSSSGRRRRSSSSGRRRSSSSGGGGSRSRSSYSDSYSSGSSSSSNVLASSTSHYYFGSFEAPLGVVITQISPRDLLEPNKITNSWFSSFGTCRAASPAIMLTTNPYGGFWTPSTAVEGLRFANDTNRLWASPNPVTFLLLPLFLASLVLSPHSRVPLSSPPLQTSGYIRSGAQLANFYALWDLDGSLLGSSSSSSSSSSSISSSSRPSSTASGFGFAIAPFDPILPPLSLRSSPSFACSYQPSWSAHTCTGPAACFRSFALFYNESVTKDQTANLGKDKNHRPYSYVTFTRLQDNATFVSVGSDNDYDDDFPKRYGTSRPLLRQVTATLLAGFSYRVTIQRSEVGPGFFYPSTVQLMVLDVGGCTGGLTVIMDTPSNSQDKQWSVVSNNPEAPCPGTPVNSSIAYRRSACINGKPMLAFDIGSTAIRSIARIELAKSTSGSTSCTTARCFMSPRRFEGPFRNIASPRPVSMGAEASKASPKSMQRTHMMVEENRVMLFSKSFDPSSMKVKSVLHGLGVRPSVCELDKEYDGEELEDAVASMIGSHTIPALFVNGRFVGGMDDVISMNYNRDLIPILQEAGALAH
ncbi:unnamed protein product [Closterium sp. NIES-53]